MYTLHTCVTVLWCILYIPVLLGHNLAISSYRISFSTLMDRAWILNIKALPCRDEIIESLILLTHDYLSIKKATVMERNVFHMVFQERCAFSPMSSLYPGQSRESARAGFGRKPIFPGKPCELHVFHPTSLILPICNNNKRTAAAMILNMVSTHNIFLIAKY